MTPPSALRVLDLGRVSPLRSQTLWHAVAHGVSEGAPPTLAFMRPAAPYVSLGFHRRLSELDLEFCRSTGLPVYRRMVGGGPVYLDDGQLFFQIVLPAGSVSPARTAALRTLLSPAVRAFREGGVAAELDDDCEIVVGDRKVCGHGAGQIEDAVVVVGNLIERFDHERATAILRIPDPGMRREVLRMMRRYVAPTPSAVAGFRDAAALAYAEALGLRPEPGGLSEAERGHLRLLDALLGSPDWLRGDSRPVDRGAAEVKIRSGVWVARVRHDETSVVLSVVGDRIERAEVTDPSSNGRAPAVAEALRGVPLGQEEQRLREFGKAGRRVAAAVAKWSGSRRDR